MVNGSATASDAAATSLGDSPRVGALTSGFLHAVSKTHRVLRVSSASSDTRSSNWLRGPPSRVDIVNRHVLFDASYSGQMTRVTVPSRSVTFVTARRGPDIESS
jgi:hypothetical protein